jgi:N-acetylglucosaminyl-diphospho-decaprenol L-rhamnosyltransferase
MVNTDTALNTDAGSTAMPGEFVIVVVVTHNSAALLAALVASLETGLEGVEWSLVIVDNESADDTMRIANELAPDAIVIEAGRNGGYAAGINLGVAAAPEHSAVLVLNPDVRLHRGCVRELVERMRDRQAGIAAPRLVDGDGELISSQRREPSLGRAFGDAVLGAAKAGRWPRLGEVVTEADAYRREAFVDWLEGSTLLISSACLDACGQWDEHFFLYSEETEFALRARDRGFNALYVPSAMAVHLEGGSAGSPELWSLLVANRLRLFALRHGRLPTALFWALITTREATRALLGRPTSRAALSVLVSPARLARPRGPDWIRPTRSVPDLVPAGRSR